MLLKLLQDSFNSCFALKEIPTHLNGPDEAIVMSTKSDWSLSRAESGSLSAGLLQLGRLIINLFVSSTSGESSRHVIKNCVLTEFQIQSIVVKSFARRRFKNDNRCS
jgi:hypothetical protein